MNVSLIRKKKKTQTAPLSMLQMAALMARLTSHVDIQGIESSCMHFDDHLVWIVYDGESGVFGKSEHTVVSVFIDHPGLHYRPKAGRSAESFNTPCMLIQPDTHTGNQRPEHAHAGQLQIHYTLITHGHNASTDRLATFASTCARQRANIAFALRKNAPKFLCLKKAQTFYPKQLTCTPAHQPLPKVKFKQPAGHDLSPPSFFLTNHTPTEA